MVVAKPDCTGQRFGMLTVLGKGSRATYKRSNRKEAYCYLWLLQCDCGARLELRRGDFDRANGRGQVSCGCKRRRGLVDNKRRPIDISGQRFGSLAAIALSGKKDAYGKPTWQMLCDCGTMCEISLSDIRKREYQGIRINCGDRFLHPEKWLSYPPTPSPYPREAGELLKKYLLLTELFYKQINSEVEDELRDRLIRIAWTITYRRSQGEIISEEYEQRLIKKTLRYASVEVKHRNYLFKNLNRIVYNTRRIGKQIGIKMTNITSNDYPELLLQENNCLPKKRFKFNRC